MNIEIIKQLSWSIIGLIFCFYLIIYLFLIRKQFKNNDKRSEFTKENIRVEWREYFKSDRSTMPPNSIIFGYRNLTREVLDESEFLVLKWSE